MTKSKSNTPTPEEAAHHLYRGHYHCEDCWYCCPMCDDYCGREDNGERECDCGKAERDARILAALTVQREAPPEGHDCNTEADHWDCE